MGYWTRLVEQADMGLLNHPWATLLEAAVERNRPELFSELKGSGEFDAYIVVQVRDALESVESQVARGTDRQGAVEEALDSMIPKAEEDLDKAEDWELEGAAEDEAAALDDFL